jgi:hypothetical protein
LLPTLSGTPRAVILGAGSVGVAAAITGLVIGLCTYPPTAPFAVLELGVPGAVLGALGALVVASITHVRRRIQRRHGP